MLKGTDGAYYEIDKASLSEVIRAELGAILADNSKNNGTSVGKVPTLNSTGNALGASSVADLASVLGGRLMPISNVFDADYDSLRTGIGYVTNGTYNLSYGIYIGCFRDSVVGTQIFIQGTMGIYVRNHGNSGWSEWKQIQVI